MLKDQIKKSFLAVLVIFAFAVIMTAAGCTANKPATTEPAKLKVVTTDADIADVANDVGGDMVNVEDIIPPGICPSTFDLKPESVKVLGEASLFLRHDYEGNMFSDKLIGSVGNNHLTMVTIGVDQQTLMVPTMRIKGIDQITAALVQTDPQDAATYQANAAKLKDETNQVAAEQKKRLDDAGVSQVKVIVAEYQADFAQWAGFDIVGTYPPDISLNDTKKLIDLGRQQGASLVIDNLQSPNQAAVDSMTSELGIQQVTLSNYPGGAPGTEKWADSFTKNIDQIIALKMLI